jgi:hypothetical protein
VLAALAGFTFKHWPHIKIICSIYILLCGSFGLVIYEYSKPLSENPPAPKPLPAPTVIAVPQPDYIEGTYFTEKEIKDIFSIGYVIIRVRDAKWTYETDQEWDTQITADWSKIEVVPDFGANMVQLHIPNYGVKYRSPNHHVFANDIYEKFPMDTYRDMLGVRLVQNFVPVSIGTPRLWFGTLSNNQLHPVFILGLRILPPDSSH